ncbi:MAG: hypothetical protein FWC17_00075 [Treponema sp.]|nr:hypothetical protein [Treponema sp.]
MSFSRLVLLFILVIMTILVSLGLFYYGSSMHKEEEFLGGYAVLNIPGSADELLVLSRLESGKDYFGGEPVCASSQRLFLDVFDSIETVPLENYFSRVFPFDPRYDSYAEKLRDFFIKDGKRFIYIPLKAQNWNSVLLDRQFNELLTGMEFSVDYFGAGRPEKPVYYFLIAYAAASFLFFIIFLFNRKKHRLMGSAVFLLPVLSCLAFFGASGIVLAALITAFFITVKDPVTEIIAPSSKIRGHFYKNILFPHRFNFLLLPLFAAGIFAVLYFSGIAVSFFLIVSAAAFIIFIPAVKILSLPRMKKHRRFTPILIIKRNAPEFAYPVYLLPFAAAAVFAALASPFIPLNLRFDASINTVNQIDFTISEEDYYAHINRQVFFSVSKLGSSSSNEEDGALFPSYFFDTDYLPSMRINAGVRNTVDVNDYPEFPLKNIIEYFSGLSPLINEEIAAPPSAGLASFADLISLFVLLLFIMPVLFTGSRKHGTPKTGFDLEKKSALRGRAKGINWNTKSLYNDRSQKRDENRVQKDA